MKTKKFRAGKTAVQQGTRYIVLDILLCSETLVSDMRHVSELLISEFGRPVLIAVPGRINQTDGGAEGRGIGKRPGFRIEVRGGGPPCPHLRAPLCVSRPLFNIPTLPSSMNLVNAAWAGCLWPEGWLHRYETDTEHWSTQI